jgi:hypothetical protein
VKSKYEQIRESYVLDNEMEKSTKEVRDKKAVRNNDVTGMY